MNKEQFIRKLKDGLKKMPQQEREDACAYYEEYFNEAGAENEGAVIEELGDPLKLSKQILEDYNLDRVQDGSQKKKIFTSTKVVVVSIVGGILAAPVAIPLAIAGVFVAISMTISVIAVVVALFLAVIGCIVGGIVTLIFGITTLPVTISGGILFIGLGLCLTAFMVVVMFWFIIFISWLIRKIAASISNRKKEKRQESNEEKAYYYPALKNEETQDEVIKNEIDKDVDRVDKIEGRKNDEEEK